MSCWDEWRSWTRDFWWDFDWWELNWSICKRKSFKLDCMAGDGGQVWWELNVRNIRTTTNLGPLKSNSSLKGVIQTKIDSCVTPVGKCIPTFSAHAQCMPIRNLDTSAHHHRYQVFYNFKLEDHLKMEPRPSIQRHTFHYVHQQGPTWYLIQVRHSPFQSRPFTILMMPSIKP